MSFLKATQLPVKAYGKTWFISPFTGNLLLNDDELNLNQKIPSKVLEALDYCDYPYKLKPLEKNKNSFDRFSKKEIDELIKIYKRFDKIGRENFFLSCLYAGVKHKYFDDTSILMSLISHIQSIEQKNSGCLQKSLCAAKLSKNSSKCVVFIGALLPTGKMHAWVIEDGVQPDIDDRGWINYRPLLALTECQTEE